MANSSPPRRRNAHVTRATSRFVVLLGNADGDAPTLDDEVDYLQVLKISHTAGGSRVPTITLRYDLAKAQARLVDTTVPVGHSRQVEIRRLDDAGRPTIVVAWGFAAAQNQQIDAASEGVTLDVRLDRFVFGEPLKTVPFSDPDVLDESLDTVRPWVFNPSIDDKLEPNMATRRADEDHGEYRFFIDPESIRTQAAKDHQEILSPASWTLPEAVLTLCWDLNYAQEWIKNPKREDLEEIFADHDGDDLIRDHKLKPGAYLPELLDDLLAPYGFGWDLVHKLNDDDDERETSFHFYRRGEGDSVDLRMQRPGEQIDMRKSNVGQLSVDYNIAELANVITVRGHVKEREVTVPLQRAWSTEDDSLDPALLERGLLDADDKPYVFRKFVLNEAGDYIDLRPEFGSDPFDLSDVFDGDVLLVRRRKFKKTISQHPSGDDANSFGVYVEFWDPDADGAAEPEEGEAEWKPEPDDPGWTKVKWPFSVLKKECGILFEGATPPERLHELATDSRGNVFHLRATATIEGDAPIQYTVDRRDSSPNGRDLELVLDLPHKFFDRRRQQLGDLKSIFVDRPGHNSSTPDEKNDTQKIEDYATELQTSEDCAEVSASVTLDGADHPDYAIGKLIGKVDGRNLVLDANKPTQGTPRKLQIVGWILHLDKQQRMELLLETFILERGDLAEVFDLK